MQELDLYKFIQENEIEVSWRGDILMAWVSHWNLGDFTDLIGEGSMDEGRVECTLQPNGTVALDLVPICEYHGIDPERIHPKDSE